MYAENCVHHYRYNGRETATQYRRGTSALSLFFGTSGIQNVKYEWLKSGTELSAEGNECAGSIRKCVMGTVQTKLDGGGQEI